MMISSASRQVKEARLKFCSQKKPKYCDTSSKISELSYDSAVLHLGIHPEEMNMCPHKDLHNSTGRSIVHGCPKQKCSTCSSPDKERIVVYPKGVLQLTRPNSRLCPSTKKGLYTAEVCLFGPPKTRMKTGREMGWKRTPSQSLA